MDIKAQKAFETKAISDHAKWVACIAKKYLGRGFDLEELVQQGMIGLLKACRKWSPDGGASLATFATVYIQCEIRNMIGEEGGDLKKGPDDRNLPITGDGPDDDERPSSKTLRAEAFEASGVKTPEDIAISNERSNALRGAINALPDCQRRVMLIALESEGYSDSQIALKINRSKPRVQQIRSAAVETIRTHLSGTARAS